MKEAFRKIISARRSVRSFKSNETIDPNILEDVLMMSQRSPSGFNIQPYKVIIVQDPLVKKQLAYSMISGNIKRVLDASITAVFLADIKPSLLLEKLQKIERDAGATENEIANLLFDAQFCLGSPSECSSENTGFSALPPHLNAMKNNVLSAVSSTTEDTELATKRLFMSLLSNFTQTPTLNASMEAWAFKSTMMVAQSFILGMTAHGYDTCPMEGFDANRIKQALSIPANRYSIPIVVAAGISNDSTERVSAVRPRYEFEQIFCRDTFDFPLAKNSNIKSTDTKK